MTITEINELTLEDVQEIIESRLYNPEDPTVSQKELDDEFIIYKTELLDAEYERIRIQDLKDRIEALDEANYAHAVLHPEIPNAAVYRRKQILENPNHIEAEANLLEIEAQDIELKAAKDSVAYIEKRKAEYPTTEELIIAMWEGSQTEIDALEAKRQTIKTKYPKGQ